jgi:hypothetical protein
MFGLGKPKKETIAAPARYRDLQPRCLIDRRSTLNDALSYKQTVELRVAVYAYAEEAFLVSATTGICEAGPPRKLAFSDDNEALGHAILDALLECYAHPKPSPDSTLKEWSVFAASGAKTGKAFESRCTYISVRTVNTAMIVEASRRSPPSDLYVGQGVPITCDPEDLGRSVRRVVIALRLLDSQDVL